MIGRSAIDQLLCCRELDVALGYEKDFVRGRLAELTDATARMQRVDAGPAVSGHS